MKRLTKEWVQKAEVDFLSARALAEETLPLHDVVCFLCQQSAEKYLKALVKEAGVPVPRTHELTVLVQLVAPHYQLLGFKRGLEFLSQFAVETRYPGKSASKRQAAAALRWAGKVRDACRPLLGIRPPTRRRK